VSRNEIIGKCSDMSTYLDLVGLHKGLAQRGTSLLGVPEKTALFKRFMLLCYSFHTRNKSDVPGPPGASLSASQAYGGFPAKHFLTSLNLDLIVIKAGVVVCASLEWRGAPGWHGVQVCIGEVCSNDIAGCVV